MHLLHFGLWFTLYSMSEHWVFTVKNVSSCTQLLDSFAQATSDFTLCSINSSRPITFCENCVHSYIGVLESYENLSKFTDENDTNCISLYENLDRLQIVQTFYQNSENLWNRAKCYECFESINGTQSDTVSKKTHDFHLYFDKFQNCSKEEDFANLCPNCMEHYINLDRYYKSITNVNEEIGVCMDLVDLMNTTWTYWSSNCCKFRKHNEYVFIGTSVGIFVLTSLFYIITRFSATMKIPMILPQRRFAESLHNLST